MTPILRKSFVLALVLLTLANAAAQVHASGEENTSSAPAVMINEIMYDPAGTEAFDEWVEIVNEGDVTVNITGWILTDQDASDDFVFPAIEIPSGCFAVIHVGAGTNSTSFSNGTAHFYMFKTSAFLGNTGDDLVLMNGSAVLDYVAYGNSTSIDRSPDGREFEPLEYVAENNTLGRYAGNWTECVPTGGESNLPVNNETEESEEQGREDADSTVSQGTISYTENSTNETADMSSEPRIEGNDSRPPRLLITDVYYYSLISESFTIYNPENHSVNLNGCYFSDGEGSYFFPDVSIGPGTHLVLAESTQGFLEESGIEADLNWSLFPHKGVFRLNNQGDELFLYSPEGTVIDVFVYGISLYNGTGWSGSAAPVLSSTEVAHRGMVGGKYVDTNTSLDWIDRESGIGRSSFYAENFAVNSEIIAFSAPENSYDVICSLVDNASSSIEINVYEFTSHTLASKLTEAADRGVNITLLLEGGPVGGLKEEEISVCRVMDHAGIDIRFMINDYSYKINDRYRFNHAKYMIVDGKTLLLTSENMGSNGFPSNHTGNRGWGVVVKNMEIARYFLGVFRNDSNTESRDIASFEEMPFYSSELDIPAHEKMTAPVMKPLRYSGPVNITPVLAPDTALSNETILGMLASAKHSIYVEQFYIYKHWGSRSSSVSANPNPYLEGLIDAARRGCEVRVLLDNSWYNTDPNDTVDNDDTIEYLNNLAMEEGLNMEARLIPSWHGFAKLHNKGMIVDNRSVLISSINWNENSVRENREAGLIVESEEVASYFLSLFEKDWIDVGELRASAGTDLIVRVGEDFSLNGSLSLPASAVESTYWLVNGSRYNGLEISLNFNTPGTYYVTFVAIDIYGREATDILTVIVLPALTGNTGDGGVKDSTAQTGDVSVPASSWTQSIVFTGLASFLFLIIAYSMRSGGGTRKNETRSPEDDKKDEIGAEEAV